MKSSKLWSVSTALKNSTKSLLTFSTFFSVYTLKVAKYIFSTSNDFVEEFTVVSRGKGRFVDTSMTEIFLRESFLALTVICLLAVIR